jgi:apolipoprotein N-acyltransferase
VTFLLVATSSSIAFVLIRKANGVKFAVAGLLFVILVQTASTFALAWSVEVQSGPSPVVVAVQPNVPMDAPSDAASERLLLDRHLELSQRGLREVQSKNSAVLVIWPESPMSFRYTRDPELQNLLGSFARANHTSVMLNSLEPAPNGGAHNSAIMINEEGRIVAQYDKIRLMPFGEYVPLPSWLPGASSVRSLVGEFVPGSSYTLMPLGAIRAGAFICIEASHPGIAREYAKGGADVLINISNDGYLGPTPVMRQHLSNAIFRAVENNRPLIRVTNNGISAFIGSDGHVEDPTPGYEPAVRAWRAGNRTAHKTFYTQNGDVFAYVCLVMTFGFLAASFLGIRNSRTKVSRG